MKGQGPRLWTEGNVPGECWSVKEATDTSNTHTLREREREVGLK
jgi:hypothetical protein